MAPGEVSFGRSHRSRPSAPDQPAAAARIAIVAVRSLINLRSLRRGAYTGERDGAIIGHITSQCRTAPRRRRRCSPQHTRASRRLRWQRSSVTLVSSCGGDGASKTAPADQTARSVILLIGDGMGSAHRTAGRLYSVGRGGQLAMDALPVEGASRTWSTDSVVTDSAAAGTALATGVKTYNDAIAVDPDGKPVQTILEMAKDRGKVRGARDHRLAAARDACGLSRRTTPTATTIST